MNPTTEQVALLRKSLEHVTTHPAEWNQELWISYDPACGTTRCLAGTALWLAGYRPLMRPTGDGALNATTVIGVDDVRYGVHEAARDALGLTPNQAAALFCAGNTLRDLWSLASRFTDGAVEVPADLPGSEEDT